MKIYNYLLIFYLNIDFSPQKILTLNITVIYTYFGIIENQNV